MHHPDNEYKQIIKQHFRSCWKVPISAFAIDNTWIGNYKINFFCTLYIINLINSVGRDGNYGELSTNIFFLLKIVNDMFALVPVTNITTCNTDKKV